MLKCGHCGSNIDVFTWQPLYRTCDAYVCSPSCSAARVRVISRLDPHLMRPMEWAGTNTSNPPKTFERKHSYIGLNNMHDTPETKIDMGMTPDTDYDDEWRGELHVRTELDDRADLKYNLFATIVDAVSTIFMSALAIGFIMVVT